MINGGYLRSRFLPVDYQKHHVNFCNIKRSVSIKYWKLPWPSTLKYYQKWRFLRTTLNRFQRYSSLKINKKRPYQERTLMVKSLLILLILPFCPEWQSKPRGYNLQEHYCWVLWSWTVPFYHGHVIGAQSSWPQEQNWGIHCDLEEEDEPKRREIGLGFGR